MEHEKPQVAGYEKPQIADYGDLTELTAGESAGTNLDATFPVGTPASDLKFSTPGP